MGLRRRIGRAGRMLLVVGSAVALAGAVGLAGCAPAPRPAPVEPTQSQSPAPTATPEAPKPIHLIAMGDMLPHDSVHANALLPGGG